MWREDAAMLPTTNVLFRISGNSEKQPQFISDWHLPKEAEESRKMRIEEDELRPDFVEALRVLFDILDTRRQGRVSYETICSRFGELPKGNLPPTFLSCVGKVASSDGYLTFDRFLYAVKLAYRDREVNNNLPLTRVQSEGRLNQPIEKRRMNSHPTMGLNGFDRRSQQFASQPSLDRYSQATTPISNHYAPLPSYSEYANLAQLQQDHQRVVMRQKKANTVRSQKEESRMRHPIPPNLGPAPRVQVVRSRPHSTASFASLASSGMENISWRNSTTSSNSDQQKRNTMHEEDIGPMVAKLDGLHKEEEELLRKSFETNLRLSDWFKERLETVEKRNRLLSKGMVTLEPAVHEQKLNFLRAHLTELNRRMVSLMETSEKGFPSHSNLQRGNLPQPADDQLVWLHRQNNLLNQELGDKTRQIEELRKEKENYDRNQNYLRVQPARPVSVTTRPSAFVRPAVQPPQMQRVSASPVKVYDTLM